MVQGDDGGRSTYGYDSASQVTSSGSQTYSYDANGNRISGGFTIGSDNEILSDGTWSYSYDAVGNRTEKTNISTGEYWVYAYDFNNRLTSATDYTSGGTVIQSAAYSYDVFENLVKQVSTTSGGTTTQKMAYDGSNIYADTKRIDKNVCATKQFHDFGNAQTFFPVHIVAPRI